MVILATANTHLYTFQSRKLLSMAWTHEDIDQINKKMPRKDRLVLLIKKRYRRDKTSSGTRYGEKKQ